MSLYPIVELYRACGRPHLEDGYFLAQARYLEVREYLEQIGVNGVVARFDELLVDDVDVDERPLPEVGESVSFRLKLPMNSSSRFHKSLVKLLEDDPNISRGKMPDDFYLIDQDYYTGDVEQPENVETLRYVCKLIESLSDLAHYHDSKSSDGYSRLVFLQPGEDMRVKPIELETRVTSNVLCVGAGLNPRLAEDLSQSSAAHDPHHSVKVGVFGTALAEFIGKRPAGDAFEYLVGHWQSFVNSYQLDLSTYLSGFAFHKAKTEVAETELKLAGEFSKVISDITGKLLGIPLALAAIVAIPKADGFIERFVILIGIFVSSLIISKTVDNQKRQFQRICRAKDLVLGSLEGRRESYPEDLATAVKKLTDGVEQDASKLRGTLSVFSLLSWLPFAVALFVFSHLYSCEISHMMQLLLNSFLPSPKT